MQPCPCPMGCGLPRAETLAVTCKTAGTLVFHDAATLQRLATLVMPGLTHELEASADGRLAYGSVYGGGIFGRNKDPDRRIVAIDLNARAIADVWDAGCEAPHGLMLDRDGLLWITAERDRAVVALDPATGHVAARIDTGRAPHWLAISAPHHRLFAANKADTHVTVLDLSQRVALADIAIPGLCEGVAVSPDGATLYVCGHAAPVVHAVDVATARLRTSLAIAGAADLGRQLRRVRVTPDGRRLLVSSHVDGSVAIFDVASLEQTALIAVGRAPMGFGFLADPDRAVVCEHDDATLALLDLTTGAVLSRVATDAGCEFALLH